MSKTEKIKQYKSQQSHFRIKLTSYQELHNLKTSMLCLRKKKTSSLEKVIMMQYVNHAAM